MATLVGCESNQPEFAKEIAASPDNSPLRSPCGQWAARVERGSDGRLSLIVARTGQSQGRVVISPEKSGWLGYFWVPSRTGSKLAINRYEFIDHARALLYDPAKATTQEVDYNAWTKFEDEKPNFNGCATSLACSPDDERLLVRIATREDVSDEFGGEERFYVVDAQSGIVMNRYWKREDIPRDWWVMHERGVAQDAYVSEMLYHLVRSKDEDERTAIVATDLWNVVDQRIDNVYAKKLSHDQTEEALYIAWYLAKKGHADALAILSANNYEYPVSSWEWSYVIKVFAAHNYRPAIPALIEDMNAASLNVAGEAFQALRVFYPDSPKTFETSEQAQTYFRNRYEADNRP
jgi:hypothetical protein